MKIFFYLRWYIGKYYLVSFTKFIKSLHSTNAQNNAKMKMHCEYNFKEKIHNKINRHQNENNLWDICYINNLNGWIWWANNKILKTNYGGKSWINILPSNPESRIYVRTKFVDENNDWTCNNFGEIFRTTDDGLSWDIKNRCRDFVIPQRFPFKLIVNIII